MVKSVLSGLALLCVIGSMSAQAQLKTATHVQSSLEDEGTGISVDKPVYFPGDTVRLLLQQNDDVSAEWTAVTPNLLIDGAPFHAAGNNAYFCILPLSVTPGSYPVYLRVTDSQGRRFRTVTDCLVVVEEIQEVERLRRYIRIDPEAGSEDPRTAVTLDRERIQSLQVVFQRDSIRERMGPQFVTITTTVMSQERTTVQTFERRVVTFRCSGDPNRDRVLFIRYRAAYGAYAAIRLEEVERVRVQLDSLPDWVVIKVRIEPDYAILIGASDRSNSVTRYFRVKGRTIETGFNFGIPKVLYDTQAEDTVDYGNTSAMLRLYVVNGASGRRFPVNFGIGTFGVNSPIDVAVGRGGFAASMFLDIVGLMRIFHIDIGMKVDAGMELTPFFPIQKKSRLLLNAHVGYSL